MHRPGGDTVFHWFTSRAATCLETIVPTDWKGIIQCDGYSAYDAFARRRDRTRITLASCMAHIRRTFHEARPHEPVRAGWILRQMQNLYQVEAGLRRRKAGPKLRRAIRACEAAPILARLRQAFLL